MTQTLRIKQTIASNRTLVLVVCIVLVVSGGWLSYSAYAAPGSHPEDRIVSSWETTAGFEHSATVTEENTLYETGQTLSNKRVYFPAISPVVDGTFVYGYTASDGGSLDVATDSTLVLQQVETSRNGEETVLWQTRKTLDTTETRGVKPGTAVEAPFSFDAAAVVERADKIETELQNPPGDLRAFVVVTVDLDGTVNGQQVDRTEEYRLPLGVGNTLYVNDPGEITDEHEQTETVLVANDPGIAYRIGGPVLLVGGLLGLVGFLVASRRGVLTIDDTEQAQLTHTADRRDFDEWISTVSLPSEVKDRPTARADSLADLVDFAIDTNNGVVQDPDTGVYSVLHGDLRYIYVPPLQNPSKAVKSTSLTGRVIGSAKQSSNPETKGQSGTADDD